MKKLILLEDETILREEWCEYLTEQGYQVDGVACIADFYRVFDPGNHRVAIIDLGLPDGEGLDLLKDLRDEGQGLGVIILTARKDELNQLKGYASGADNYLVKPVRLAILAATVAAIMRRTESNTETRDDVTGVWRLNCRDWSITPPGADAIALSAKDFCVLRAIIEGCGDTVTRRAIIAAQDEDYLQYDQRRLDTQMRRLRKKVREATGVELPIKTVHGIGYAFTAPVSITRYD